ncbi:hypothetical protein [Streptomyces genisteinicus]|uniref:Aromatic ring-opening dioxygenase LigA n=1 Tax=Streptomyces genisteinicus TaxID=2768068 RepID=A0A7H0HZ28_9ACTN|nr:hypothetical protein [Streptomyces genisteinicus]QNP65794.1 hypothetical protein IAG43_24565 [Streptomyces genisteinicus]
MTRTTPPRPVDVEAVFPELAAHRRTATRLHPRPGVPKAEESSVAGPLLWPADEPWPVCTAVHPKDIGHRLADVRERRRILAGARGRDVTEEERRVLDGMTRGPHAPRVGESDPLPLLAVAQLWTRDVPDLAAPEGCDLLQVFWCPFEVHGPDRTIDVILRWRRSADVGAVLADQPEPPVAGREECVPTSCVLHPEQVVEHEYLGLLDEDLRERIADWEEGLLDDDDDDDEDGDGDDDGCDAGGGPAPASYATYEEYAAAMAAARAAEPDEVDYMSDLSIAPGWKAGGFASWHLTDPAPVDCPRCGAPMPPLLTVATVECDGASRSWLPVEDREDDRAAIDPVGVYLGRGLMRVHTCPADPDVPHRLSFQ